MNRKCWTAVVYGVLCLWLCQGCAAAGYGGGIQVVDGRAPSSSAPSVIREPESSQEADGGSSSTPAATVGSSDGSACELPPVILDRNTPSGCFAGITSVDAYYILNNVDSPYMQESLAWADDLTPETAAWVRTFSSTQFSQNEIIHELQLASQQVADSKKWYWVRICATPQTDGDVLFYLLAR